MMQRNAAGPSFPAHHVAGGEDSDDSEDVYFAVESEDAEMSDFEPGEELHESTSLTRQATKEFNAAESVVEREGRPPADGDGVDEQGILPRDKQRRTTHYNYQLEKQMSHVEAKQFYQQQRQSTLDEQSFAQSGYAASPTAGRSPVMRARTYSSHVGGDASAFTRTGSLRSKQSNLSHSGTQDGHGQYQSALPIGLSDPKKDPRSANIQMGGIGRFEGVNGVQETPVSAVEDPYAAADRAARAHALHPGLPHEAKPMLEKEGIHGAGAGIGLDTNGDSSVTSELSAIYTNIQKVLDLRHKYIRLSLQGPTDNPRDEPGWKIYPPMPEPVWHQDG